jgi:sucrose phosphorylase
MLSQTIPLAMRGIPAVYINALTATANDPLGVERTGMTRAINRRKWDGAELERLIDNPLTDTGQVFPEYIRRLRLRRGINSFHPDASQQVMALQDGVFGLERCCPDGRERVLAIHNLTADTVVIALPRLLDKSIRWYDALQQGVPDMDDTGLRLRPYQVVWLLELQRS